jgi:hypothetical protein
MTHAIIRGENGRRHEVDFGDAPVRVEVYASEETVESLWKQILKRTRRDIGGLRSSISRAIFSAKLQAKRRDARQGKSDDVSACGPLIRLAID